LGVSSTEELPSGSPRSSAAALLYRAPGQHLLNYPCARHFTETTARPFFPHPAASEPPFEVEYFGRGAQPGPQQRSRRQERDVVAGASCGGAIGWLG